MINTREIIYAKIDELCAQGRADEALRLMKDARYTCECGGAANEQVDAYGYYVGYLCDKCYSAKYVHEHMEDGV